MMKARPFPRWTAGAAAFSLPEVTISMGIVAVLMLPALAMLAGGGSMQSLAEDRELASRLAREITSGIVESGSGDGFEISFSTAAALRLGFPEGQAPTTVFAAFTREGKYLREISEAEFIRGISSPGDPVHLARVTLARSSREALLDLTLSLQRPAAAAEVSRAKEIFQTRLAIP